MHRTPVLIVGGGPAGAAAAIALARGGAECTVLERTSGPHDVVCGGFLSWDSLASLSALGLDAAALGARPIGRVRLCSGRRVVEADLPYPATGLSRRRLDAALLDAACDAGADVVRGAVVREVDLERRSVRLDDGERRGAALLVATGKHEVRGSARPLASWRGETSVGLRAALPWSAAGDAALAGVVELHLLDGGYAGLLLQEDGTTNLCLSVRGSRMRSAGTAGCLIAELCAEAPLLAARLGSDMPPRFDAVAGVPYGWRARGSADGVMRVGDQAAVIASLAGDGVGLALASGLSAAQAILGGESAASAWQARFAAAAAAPLRLAEALRYAAEHQPWRAAMMTLLPHAPALLQAAARRTRVLPPPIYSAKGDVSNPASSAAASS